MSVKAAHVTINRLKIESVVKNICIGKQIERPFHIEGRIWMKIIIESFEDLERLLEMFGSAPKQEDKKMDPKKEDAPKKDPVPEKKTRNRNIDYGKIKALKDAGWTAEKIADEMKISVATVYNHSKGV